MACALFVPTAWVAGARGDELRPPPAAGAVAPHEARASQGVVPVPGGPTWALLAGLVGAAVRWAGGGALRRASRGRRCAVGLRAWRDPDEPGDTLIPQQPIGRLVTKGDVGALEYDPADAPEYVSDEHGNGMFSWEPLTPEGGLLDRDEEFAEKALPVPRDRIDYLLGSGYLQAEEGEDYRAYIDDEVEVLDGREWQRIVLRGNRNGVEDGMLRLMRGVLRRRPWELEQPPSAELHTGVAPVDKLPESAAPGT